MRNTLREHVIIQSLSIHCTNQNLTQRIKRVDKINKGKGQLQEQEL